jgi:type III secretion system FlhB-like substrate exporter
MSRIHDEVMAALEKTKKHYKIQYDKKYQDAPNFIAIGST